MSNTTHMTVLEPQFICQILILF